MLMKTTNVRAAVSCAVLAMFGTMSAHADVISISGNSAASTEGLGNFSGSLTFASTGPNSGTASLTLTNTTAPATGGFITGVVLLNSALHGGMTVSLTSTTDADFLNTGTESGSPFGSFQGGAALGANWLGGGSPNPGIAIGSTETFVFSITGTGAGALTASQIALDSGLTHNLVVRFRGMVQGGSDKVPTVPAPGAAAALAMGGLLAGRRNRRMTW